MKLINIYFAEHDMITTTSLIAKFSINKNYMTLEHNV